MPIPPPPVILLIGDHDRVWLRVAADAIRATARRDGLSPPAWVAALELAATVRPSETNPRISDDLGDDPPMPLLYKREEAAELLRVSPRSVDRLIAAGELRSVRVLNDRRIARKDLLEFVERRRHQDQEAS